MSQRKKIAIECGQRWVNPRQHLSGNSTHSFFNFGKHVTVIPETIILDQFVPNGENLSILNSSGPRGLINLVMLRFLICIADLKNKYANSLRTFQIRIHKNESGSVLVMDAASRLVPTTELVASTAINDLRHLMIKRTRGSQPSISVLIIRKLGKVG